MSLDVASYLKRAAGPLLKSPLSDGAAGEALITDGDGNLSFAAPAPAAHDHDGDYDALGTAATAIANHAAAGDPHPQYLTAAEGNAAYDVSGAAAAAQAASQPLDAQLTSLASLSYSGNANKVVRVNAGESAFELASVVAGGASEIDINTQSAGYTLQASDLGDLIDFTTAGVTLTLPAAATAGDKFYCYVRHSGAVTTVLTVDGEGAETIDGAATLVMFAGEVRLLICTGSAWVSQELYRPVRGVLTKPVDSQFSWVNQGSATIATTRGGLLLSAPSNGTAYGFRARVKSAPATPYTITACFLAALGSGGLCFAGLVFRQSSDGKLVAFESGVGNDGSSFVNVRKMTNPTTYSADYVQRNNANRIGAPGPIWMRIADDGTNRNISFSHDGEDFGEAVHSVGRTDFLTADQVGFYVNPYAVYARMTLLSWKEE